MCSCLCACACVRACVHAWRAGVLSLFPKSPPPPPQHPPSQTPQFSSPNHFNKFHTLFSLSSFQNLEDLVLNTEADAEGKENSDSNRRTKILIDFPLSWEDQVSRPEVKVISARPTPRDGNREVRSYVVVVVVLVVVVVVVVVCCCCRCCCC